MTLSHLSSLQHGLSSKRNDFAGIRCNHHLRWWAANIEVGDKWLNQATSQSMDEAISQWDRKSVSQSNSQLVSQTVSQSDSELVSQSVITVTENSKNIADINNRLQRFWSLFGDIRIFFLKGNIPINENYRNIEREVSTYAPHYNPKSSPYRILQIWSTHLK